MTSATKSRKHPTTEVANPPSRKPLLQQQAYDEIKRKLLAAEVESGKMLSERSLADMLGMSKTPIRAALQRLESEGLISLLPNQGILVRELTITEIADQYEVRILVEAYAARTIAGKLLPEQIEALRRNLGQQRETIGSQSILDAVRLDTEFHELLLGYLKNSEFSRWMLQFRDRINRVITKVFRLAPERFESSYAEHSAIAEAVIGGEGDRAAELVVKHLEIGRKMLLSPRG